MTFRPIEIQITADPTDAEAGFDRVRKSLREVDAATEEYERSLEELDRAQKRGLITASKADRQARELAKEYERQAREAAQLAGATLRVDQAQRRSAASASRVARSSGQMRGQIQNAAFQVQDLAVQIGAGTSATAALGQQLPQLLGGFGAMGAVIGGVVAVGGALAPTLLDIGGSAKSAEDATEEFTSALEAFGEISQAASGNLRALREEFGLTDDAARGAAEALRAVAVRELKEDFDGLVASLIDSGDVVGNFVDLLPAMERGGRSARAIRQSFESLPEPVQAAVMALDSFNKQGTDDLDALRSQAAETLSALQALNDPTYDPIIKALGGIVAALGRVKKAAEDARNAATMRPASFSFGDGSSNQGALGMIAGAFSGGGGGAGGGGGGGGSQPDRIGSLARSLATEQELLDDWRETSLEKLSEFNERELELVGGQAEAKRRIEAKYLEDIGKLEEQNKRSKVQQTKDTYRLIAGLMQSESKVLFNIGKAAAIANAIIDAEAAITGAYKVGARIGGPPLGYAYGAAAAAATAVRIQKIAQTEIGGSSGASSSGGGGGGGGGGAAAPQAASQNTTYFVNLQGESFSRQSVERTITTVLQKQLDSGDRLVFSRRGR